MSKKVPRATIYNSHGEKTREWAGKNTPKYNSLIGLGYVPLHGGLYPPESYQAKEHMKQERKAADTQPSYTGPSVIRGGADQAPATGPDDYTTSTTTVEPHEENIEMHGPEIDMSHVQGASVMHGALPVVPSAEWDPSNPGSAEPQRLVNNLRHSQELIGGIKRRDITANDIMDWIGDLNDEGIDVNEIVGDLEAGLDIKQMPIQTVHLIHDFGNTDLEFLDAYMAHEQASAAGHNDKAREARVERGRSKLREIRGIPSRSMPPEKTRGISKGPFRPAHDVKAATIHRAMAPGQALHKGAKPLESEELTRNEVKQAITHRYGDTFEQRHTEYKSKATEARHRPVNEYEAFGVLAAPSPYVSRASGYMRGGAPFVGARDTLISMHGRARAAGLGDSELAAATWETKAKGPTRVLRPISKKKQLKETDVIEISKRKATRRKAQH